MRQKSYRRGDVVEIDMPEPESGHVQGGRRPWVVIQNDMGNFHAPTTIVVPMTTSFKRMDLPTHVIVVPDRMRPSMVACEQVRVIDQSDDWKYITHLSDESMAHVDQGLRNAFWWKGVKRDGRQRHDQRR